MQRAALQERYDGEKQKAERLAGSLLDIPQRVLLLNEMFTDSRANHTFPLLAAHGALWAYSYFEVGGVLGRWIARRYFYNPVERAFRLAVLEQFASAFRKVNRQVCIDTLTNYRFSAQYGQLAGADEIIPPGLLEALNRVHCARAACKPLTAVERRKVFEQSFLCEQEITVGPGVQAAVDALDCRIMKFICMHPLVRFAYFPRFQYLFFRNFASTTERIENGQRAFAIAEQAGWDKVAAAQTLYGVPPAAPLQTAIR